MRRTGAGRRLMTSFEQYVKDGGGVVTVHAADNAFPNWKAFNEMIGVGGWRNRTEKAGPMWYYNDGKLVSDPTPGPAGSRQSPAVPGTTRAPEHPIMKGLPKVWMHPGDELYAQNARPRNEHDGPCDGPLDTGKPRHRSRRAACSWSSATAKAASSTPPWDTTYRH